LRYLIKAGVIKKIIRNEMADTIAAFIITSDG
jgi:hypothetical protein